MSTLTDFNLLDRLFVLVLWCLTPLSTIFQLHLVISFIGGGNRSTMRKPPTCRKSRKNFICLLARTVSQAHRSFEFSIANLTSSDSLENCSDVVF